MTKLNGVGWEGIGWDGVGWRGRIGVGRVGKSHLDLRKGLISAARRLVERNLAGEHNLAAATCIGGTCRADRLHGLRAVY